MDRTTCGVVVFALCASLAFMPADAADFTLEIFGNANMDDTIDELDIEYVQGIIDGTNDETELADANYDGVIDEVDIEQIGMIMDGNEKVLILIDYDGFVKAIHMPVKRIVTGYGYVTWAVDLLGAGDRIVGVDKTTNDQNEIMFPSSLADLPCIGSSREYDVETILELEPDLVLLHTRKYWGSQDLETKIETAMPNSTVYAIMPRNIGSFEKEMAKLSYILDEKDAWNKLNEWIDVNVGGIIDQVAELSEEDQPTVFRTDNLETGKNTYYTYASDNDAENLLIKKAGGINIAKDLPGDFIEIEAEWVLQQNPDIMIIADWNDFGYIFDDPSKAAEIRANYMNQSALNQINAVKNERVYIVNWFSMVTEWFVGLPYLAKVFWPEEFKDLDPEAIHQEFLTEFRGDLGFDLNEHGTFMYPPIETADGFAGVPDRFKGHVQ